MGTQPPYTAPSDAVYPEDHVGNPHVGSTAPQPVYLPIPEGALFRPAYLPKDVDQRIDQSSIWMSLTRDTQTAVYFIPPACQECADPKIATHCSRSQPVCARCQTKGLPCTPGRSWAVLEHKASGDDAARDGMKRTPKVLKQTTGHTAKCRKAPIKREGSTSPVSHRGKKQHAIDDQLAEVKLKAALGSKRKPGPPARREDANALARYHERVTINEERPTWDNRAVCPVWAESFAELGVLEYFNDPVTSFGARVSISKGGIARGIILEGDVPRCGWFNADTHTGSIIVPLGHDRPRQHDPTSAKDTADMAAIFATHRYRTPVALALTHDYSNAPFRILQPIIVLGWFWITATWTESVASDSLFVQPMVRFDHCWDQDLPWWTRVDEDELEEAMDADSWDVAHDDHQPSEKRPEMCKVTDYTCVDCSTSSPRIYEGEGLCLNEACPRQAVRAACRGPPLPLKPETRILPSALRLRLCPDEPTEDTPTSDPNSIWSGWVCHTCGKANERRSWTAWECSGCERAIGHMRKIMTSSDLKGVHRPVCTGPRQEGGFAKWP